MRPKGRSPELPTFVLAIGSPKIPAIWIQLLGHNVVFQGYCCIPARLHGLVEVHLVTDDALLSAAELRPFGHQAAYIVSGPQKHEASAEVVRVLASMHAHMVIHLAAAGPASTSPKGRAAQNDR